LFSLCTYQVLLQPLSDVIKRYFVPIFGLSIAARCGTGPEKDLAETVLYESLLQLGEISEFERDDLIRKHMVCSQRKHLPVNLYAMLAVLLCHIKVLLSSSFLWLTICGVVLC
jgi:ataxia telangiectasia mutated family protein